ncbi:hypothetical protein L1887_35509 [Cichorium endivia]|nr:hypothetical protein L1887_35509 [Cichorium endivia]
MVCVNYRVRQTINSIGVLQHEKLATLRENLHFRKEQLSKAKVEKMASDLKVRYELLHPLYSMNDWKKEGIKYVKINCKRRGSVPENEAVNQFVYEASCNSSSWRGGVGFSGCLVFSIHNRFDSGALAVILIMKLLKILVGGIAMLDIQFVIALDLC